MKVAFDKLKVSRENPRKTQPDRAAHDALVASIRAHGLIQPLVVRALADNDNKYEVVDGSRRFHALLEIGADTVECHVNKGPFGIAEIGTAANMMRSAMHPLDEADVITRLMSEGDDAEAIGLRFGQTERWAMQRAKLSGLSAKTQKLFREDAIGLRAAQALTLGTTAQQDKYLKSATKPWQLESGSIERHFTEQSYNAKVAIFELDKYPKSAMVRDLFGEDIWLTDTNKFVEMQTVAATTLAESVRAEGWSDVLLLLDGRDQEISTKYVTVTGRISKAERAKHVSMVVFDPRDGSVSVTRGLVSRKSANKIAKGEKPGEDTVAAEDVRPSTPYDLSRSQNEIIGAMLTSGVERAIARGDGYLALITLVGALLEKDKLPPWGTIQSSPPSYLNVNVMLTEKIENTPSIKMVFPTRAQFDKMSAAQISKVLCAAATNVMQVMVGRDKWTEGELVTLAASWFRLDEGFLKRYRLDALQLLAKKLKVPFEDVKKKDLITAIMAGGQTFIPLK